MWFYSGAVTSQVDLQRDCYTCLDAHVNTLTEESFVIFVTFSPRAPVSSTVRLPPLCHAHSLNSAAVCRHTHTHKKNKWVKIRERIFKGMFLSLFSGHIWKNITWMHFIPPVAEICIDSVKCYGCTSQGPTGYIFWGASYLSPHWLVFLPPADQTTPLRCFALF